MPIFQLSKGMEEHLAVREFAFVHIDDLSLRGKLHSFSEGYEARVFLVYLTSLDAEILPHDVWP